MRLPDAIYIRSWSYHLIDLYSSRQPWDAACFFRQLCIFEEHLNDVTPGSDLNDTAFHGSGGLDLGRWYFDLVLWFEEYEAIDPVNPSLTLDKQTCLLSVHYSWFCRVFGLRGMRRRGATEDLYQEVSSHQLPEEFSPGSTRGQPVASKVSEESTDWIPISWLVSRRLTSRYRLPIDDLGEVCRSMLQIIDTCCQSLRNP